MADSATGKVAIFVGDGQGGFSPGPVLAGGDTPSGLVAGRFGDGHVDLIVADEGDPITGQGQGLTVFQADGPDAFQLSRTIAAGSGPSAIVAGDFGNGAPRPGRRRLELRPSLHPSEQRQRDLSGPRGPTLSEACRWRWWRATSATAHLDLAIANANSDDVSVLLGNGDGTFEPQLRFGAGSFPASLVTADFNGDGRLDLAAGNQGFGRHLHSSGPR